MDVPLRTMLTSNRAITLVVGSTVLLTMALLGVVAAVTGRLVGYGTRLPVYFLGGAVLFVVLVFQFERREYDGRTTIRSTAGLAVVGTVLLFLIGEGAVYVVSYPGQILASQLVIYLLAVGVVCTGLVYWGLNHWREYVSA